MLTNLELNDKFVQEAFSYANVSTKQDLINLALQEYVDVPRRYNMSELLGKVKIREDYDYKSLRQDKSDSE